MSETVGMIGVGQIGLPICKNLMERGHTVWGYRRSSLEEFEKAGGKPASNAKEVAENCEIIFTCLPTEQSLFDTISGDNGILAADRKNSPLVVELSTFKIPTKEKARTMLAEKGGQILDCPVSGTPPMVAERKGVLFASGDEDAYERVEGLLPDCLDMVIYCGEFGNGMKLKYVANILVAVHNYAAAEAVAFAEAIGLDSKFAIDALKNGPCASMQLGFRGPMMAERKEPPPLGTHDILTKDLRAIKEVADELGFQDGLLDVVVGKYEEALSEGLGPKDIATMIRLFDKS